MDLVATVLLLWVLVSLASGIAWVCICAGVARTTSRSGRAPVPSPRWAVDDTVCADAPAGAGALLRD